MSQRPKLRLSAVKLTKRRLEALISQAVADAHDDDEALMGFESCLDDALKVPFKTAILGVEVTVTGVHLSDENGIVAGCARGRERLEVPILNLPIPSPPPRGAEWIEAYRSWRRR